MYASLGLNELRGHDVHVTRPWRSCDVHVTFMWRLWEYEFFFFSVASNKFTMSSDTADWMGALPGHVTQLPLSAVAIPGNYLYMADSRFAPSQWETALLCNDVSHLLGVNLESAMFYMITTFGGFSLFLYPFFIIWANCKLGQCNSLSWVLFNNKVV